ncbi:MAG TPA: hypothetical protein VK157_12455 [Phycisphaerales bacterium]|nr:hypothetical protein [Phycisphaerales bacterium]
MPTSFAQPHVARRGYTIVELLAVAGLLVLLLAFAASGLSGLLKSSEKSLAENQLRVGLTAARDLALRSDNDAVAVFFLENGRCRIVPAVSAGFLKNDEVLGVDGQAVANVRVDREVFVPVTLSEPITLPLRWTVRGFADPGLLHTTAAPNGWYEWINDASATVAEAGNWVLPETSVVDIAQAEQGWRRQTFVVRYEGKTGNLVTNNNATVLVVDVVASDEFRDDPPYDEAANRLDELDGDLLPVVRRMLSNRNLHPAAAQLNQTTDLHKLLGDRSTDTVLARPVQTIALALETNVASGVSARSLNRSTNSLLVSADAATNPSPIDVALFSGIDAAEVQERINAWIAPDLSTQGTPPNGVQEPYDARIFTFSRYLGAMQEVKP